ncbi:MAG: hypothetical protein O7B29_13890, partial [Deltaproteobacteria bacterium]|nr:hypothetical protein [Deltaproteobacteria bacterium]
MRYRPDVGEAEIAAIHASSGARVLEVIEKLGIYRLALPVGHSATRMRDEFSAATPSWLRCWIAESIPITPSCWDESYRAA